MCFFKTPSPFSAMEAAIKNWFEKHKHVSNGMLTTTNLDIPGEGQLQVKWWKQKKFIIVKTITLHKTLVGKSHFTNLCKSILEDYKSEVEAIVLESVLEHQLFIKLQSKGWKADSSYLCSNNLTLQLFEGDRNTQYGNHHA